MLCSDDPAATDGLRGLAETAADLPVAVGLAEPCPDGWAASQAISTMSTLTAATVHAARRTDAAVVVLRNMPSPPLGCAGRSANRADRPVTGRDLAEPPGGGLEPDQ